MRKILGILFMVILATSCAKEDGIIPDLPVNFKAPLTDPRLSRLSAPQGAVSLTGYGVAGIIIFNTGSGYRAYDRCSTVNPEQKNAVNLDDSGLTATDPVSGAKYSLYDGSPAKAPAKTSLKEYGVTVAGGTLQVTN